MNPTFKMWGKEIGNHTHDTTLVREIFALHYLPDVIGDVGWVS
jgi:hypothetical protein